MRIALGLHVMSSASQGSMQRRLLRDACINGVVSQQSGEAAYPQVFSCVGLHHSAQVSFQGLQEDLQETMVNDELCYCAVPGLALQQLNISTHPVLAAPKHECPRICLLCWILHLFHMRALLPLHGPANH